MYHNTTYFQDVLTEKEFLEMPLSLFVNYFNNIIPASGLTEVPPKFSERDNQ